MNKANKRIVAELALALVLAAGSVALKSWAWRLPPASEGLPVWCWHAWQGNAVER